MAQGTVGRPAPNTATASSSNGILTANNAVGLAGVNRKKQKRRQKQAAKAAAEQEQALRQAASGNPHASNGRISPTRSLQSSHDDPRAPLERYDDDPYYTDEDARAYHQYHPALPNGHASGHEVAANGSRKNKKKKKKERSAAHDPYLEQSSSTYPPSAAHSHLPHTSSTSKAAIQSVKHSNERDRIWNTSTQEERERIKEFWLSLGEDERKSLVKIEKEAVLRKMKEQQKHSCSCTVCGRKRTAIEEELEVLYDAYYDELEQYGSLQHGPMFAGPKHLTRHADSPSSEHIPPLIHTTQPPHGHIEELPDEDEEDEDEDEDELYSDEEAYDDEYSDDEPEGLSRAAANDFFNFGNSLTVKGGILTVADDLLKNDGKKFIEMMEQLAERRVAREEDAQIAAASHPSSSYHGSYGHNHPPDDEEYDEEDDEDYDSQEDFDEEDDDEMDVMTEEQRMEEGRRMFQIFAARMFEQRVLTAYREKVAHDRQLKLLEELEEEKSHDVQREAKKARDARKKKEKKALQKQKQAEEKARKEAEKAAEEAAAKAAEEKRQEELRKKREEQRKKKEAERKAQEEEKQRKEAERLKRQQEDRERQQEAERRAREQKAAEKRARDEEARKKREEREAKDREAKERKAQAEKEKREREEKAKADREAQDRARKEAAQAAHQAAQAPKRPGAPTAVPIPPSLQKMPSNVSSPHIPVATPALPKAPTPVRARQGSQHGSKVSSPKTPSVAASQAKSASPTTTSSSQQLPIVPKTILQKPPAQTQSTAPQQAQPASPMHSMPPPPGMPMPQTSGFAGPPGLNGFPVSQGPMMPGMIQRGPSMHNSQIFQPQGPPPGGQFRPFAPPVAIPPAGMAAPVMPFGRGFPEPPPGLPQQFPAIGTGTQGGQFNQLGRESIPVSSGPGTHSRQTSFEQKPFEPTTSGPPAQPIARPAPIKRPSSVKPDAQEDQGPDVDDITRHLGSSALLEDADDPIPLSAADMPRSGAPSLIRGGSNMSAFGASPIFTNSLGQQRMDSFGPSSASNPSSAWSTPPMPFGQGGLPGAPSWGGSPNGGWPSVGPSLAGFGIGMGSGGGQHTQLRRPVQIRLNICNACRQLTSAKAGNTDGFFDAGAVLRQMENNGVQLSVSAKELLDICETEGNSTNGGGVFQVKRTDNPLLSQIKYEPEQTSGPRNGGPGDIGSPTFASASLSGGPFGSMRGFPGFGTLNG